MSHFVNYLRNGSFYLLFLKIMVEKCKLINIIRINLKKQNLRQIGNLN